MANKPHFCISCKIAIILLLLCLLSPSVLAEPEAVTAARQSVVHLYGMGTDSEAGTRLRWTGTGIAVGIAGEETDVFLTNWHVASGNGQCAPESVQLWILRDDAVFDSKQAPLAEYAFPCRVLCSTGGFPDMAVVQTAEPVPGCPALPLLSSRRVADGTEVYALGFPGIANLTVSAPENVTVTQGIVQMHLTMASAGDTRCLVHSAAIAPGFSGGPLVNAQGEVVAVNTYGFEKEKTDSLFCAVYSDYAMELLEQQKIPYTQAKSGSPARAFLQNLFYRADMRICGGGIIFFAGILAFFLLMGYDMKRKHRRGRARSETAEDSEDTHFPT